MFWVVSEEYACNILSSNFENIVSIVLCLCSVKLSANSSFLMTSFHAGCNKKKRMEKGVTKVQHILQI